MSSLREESGFNLVEVLVAMSLMIVVLGAVLKPLQSLWGTTRGNTLTNEAQDKARLTVDRLSKELRNAGGSTVVERSGAKDIVFQIVDRNPPPTGSQNTKNIARVRYCLDDSTQSNEKLWRQVQTWTTPSPPSAMPSTTSCPDTSWGSTRAQLVQNIVNNNGQTRSVFSYTTNSSTPPQVNTVDVVLYIDAGKRNSLTAQRESTIRSGVVLRNQYTNTAPTASFTAQPAPSGKIVYLNGTASTDPEGDPLTYRWCDTTSNSTCDGTTSVGSGANFTYTAPASGNRSFVLQVFDSAGAMGSAGPQTVAVNP